MPYIDQNGLAWTRSDDRLTLICEDGRKVIGNEQMTDEYMASVAYVIVNPPKTDSDRIAELEAHVAALLAKLS